MHKFNGFLTLFFNMMVFDRLIRLHCTLCTHTKCWIQNLLTDTDGLRCDLQKLVSINEIQCLLQRKDLWRCQLQRIIGTGCTCIRKLLLLADIYFDILCLDRKSVV